MIQHNNTADDAYVKAVKADISSSFVQVFHQSCGMVSLLYWGFLEPLSHTWQGNIWTLEVMALQDTKHIVSKAQTHTHYTNKRLHGVSFSTKFI